MNANWPKKKGEDKTFVDWTDIDQRYFQSYHWLDIYFDPEVAKVADSDSEYFQQAVSWYAAFRWIHNKGCCNPYLDKVIKSGFNLGDVSKDEYQMYYRTWFRELRFRGWSDQ